MPSPYNVSSSKGKSRQNRANSGQQSLKTVSVSNSFLKIPLRGDIKRETSEEIRERLKKRREMVITVKGQMNR